MKKALVFPLQVSFCTVGYLLSASSITHGQVTSDGTVNTQVIQNSNVSEITGGETRGSNLFHSFQDFSITTGNQAFFNNANDISNIFSRVTGGNISNIDGVIRANGSANLFLINPAGIIFGENARLDIGGSFYGSSATSVLFEDGEFSTADLDNPPLLTINAPIGLGFRDNPGDIVNRSTVQNGTGEVIGLEVNPSNNLTFVAGNLNFEGGSLTASGGDIYLSAISESGTVEISENGSLSFAEDISRGDITLGNGSEVDVRGFGGGNIQVDVRDLNLEGGELGLSRIIAGIREESTAAEAQAGDITIDATGNISLNEGDIINNQEGIGNGGSVFITTGSLSLLNGGLVASNTQGQGNAGTVNVTATGDITADGESNLIVADGVDLDARLSGITSRVEEGAVGDSGGVTVSTNNLNLTDGGRVDASTNGRGNAAPVMVTATGDISIDGEGSNGDASRIASRVTQKGVGNAGGVTVSTNNLTLTNGGAVDGNTGGQGNAEAVTVTATGDITIDGTRPQLDRPDVPNSRVPSGITSRVSPRGKGNAGGVTVSTNNLTLTNGGRIDATTARLGNAGSVEVRATGDINIDGERQLPDNNTPSGITSTVNSNNRGGGVGNSGGVTVSTNNLNLTNGGLVSASTNALGNAGVVEVRATGDINIEGKNSGGAPSRIASRVDVEGVGDAGGVTVSTNNLNLTAGGSVSASTLGQGNANNVTIEATESITIDGFIEGSRSGISANAFNQNGNGGELSINTETLSVANGGTVEATNFDDIGGQNSGTGRPGSINIVANSIALTDNARIETATQFAGGESGVINLQVAEDIILRNNSFISAQAFNNADGGNLNIDSKFTIAFPSDGNGNGNDIIANAEDGVGGNIQINSILLGIQQNSATENNNSNDIDARSRFSLDGNITINNPDDNLIQGAAELPSNVVEPGETIQQACRADRESAAKNSFTIQGKGGILPKPGQPLNSLNVTVNGEYTSAIVIPAPIETIQGKLQPARGLKLSESGDVILTAHRTNDSGSRISEVKRNCI